MEAYFIIDDWCDSLNREGFIVMHGSPQTAIGTQQGEFKTLTDALEHCHKHMEQGERVYRVFLARRHGEHRVTVILGWHHAPFMEHGVWQAMGFNVFGEHFNRAFRSKRACEKFLTAMRRGDPVERY